MAHIHITSDAPGIVGLMQQHPASGAALSALAETLLRGPSSLTPAERELIAAHVSRRNDCHFCASSHAAAAKHLLSEPQRHLAEVVQQDPTHPDLDEKMQALLAIAGKVQQGGKRVSPEDVERARAVGADDQAIHDTVLVAAAFCMFNRYVDGLGTWAPLEAEAYDPMGAMLATRGYLNAT
jgi:uncharacterized peroxidase-related enzyme